MKKQIIGCLIIALFIILAGCKDGTWNNPHSAKEATKNIYYASFSERPKTLDPARAYSSNEALFTGQIYEPPLQYHYLKRPYTLIPLTANSVPKVKYLDKNHKPTSKPEDIAFSVYEITIKPGINYQPHPAFAKDKQGNYRYHQLSEKDIANVYALTEFKDTGTRELIAEDYVYQIKRLAHPAVQSPILGLMSKYIVGLADYNKTLNKVYKQQQQPSSEAIYLDLRQYDFQGAKVVDRYTYQIKLKGKYPQFKYWLAMPFFVPMPWEADLFYSQKGMADKNLTLDWYPVGTGPYMLTENNPNRQMVLAKNPNYHGETYPKTGTATDKQQGLLEDAGKPLPFVDQYIFSLEKESIPRWTKFLQGYYDQSGISSDNFDQAIKIDAKGRAYLTPDMQQKNLSLQTSVNPAIYYIGFNMLDDVVGGYSDRAKKLRQAISIAIDYEEFISIFLNGRGIPAQSPLPPGIFGFQAGEKGINSFIYDWKNNQAKRKSLQEAKKLLAAAGYPQGRDAKTGQPLILYFDITTGSGPDDNARFEWLRKQFEKLGIQLQIRATQYNRFQEKMRTGHAQIFMWGWLADYPDPENFLFLLYGANGKVKFGGENAANYHNPKFDKLFDQMKNLPNGPKRQQVINQMLNIAQADAPWIWGFHPQSFQLSHQWLRKNKPNDMANNTLKYQRINPELRADKRKGWNQPIIWPIGIFGLLLIVGIVPFAVRYWRKEHVSHAKAQRR